MKCMPLTRTDMESHGQALYSLLLKPIVNSTTAWRSAAEHIKQLADCLLAYSQYLQEQLDKVKRNQALDHPVRMIATDATVEHRTKTFFPAKKYQLLDEEVKLADINEPVLFDESKHLNEPFEDNVLRYRFINELQLSEPVDLIRFCPGGSITSSVCVVKVQENRTETERVTDSARFLQQARPLLKEFHTRAQKTAFKQKLRNVTHVLPSVADMIYKELTLDASTANHPETQERLRLIFLGEKGLLADLRHLNTGKPTGTYDQFFEELAKLVEELTAADERRHNVAHLSEWINLEEMIKKAAERCPEGTLVPSKSLVRLQFAPRNPYSHRALSFTSRIPVQYKIQIRQLRVGHEDAHYCAAQFKYQRARAIELGSDAALFFCDDKAKVPVGEPGVAVSTGVRGKKTIAPVRTVLGAADHDLTKSSLTPSVVLKCLIPGSIEESFYRGQVTVTVNDSVFQASSPFRHTVMLSKLIESEKVVLKFTDGGTDQRTNLESIKCASICLFLEHNLDMLIHVRCAPGQSWCNPAERVMSLLNIALQNCSIERTSCDEETERMLKKSNSMKATRSLAAKKPELEKKWQESVQPVQSLLRERFMRLKLKDKAIATLDPVTVQEIENLQRHLREHFPELDTSKLQKCHTEKVKSYTEWKAKHCRERRYVFQIKKCTDESCCVAPQLPREMLSWLPDPVMEDDGEHFKTYQQAMALESTTDKDCPSIKAAQKAQKAPRMSVKATAVVTTMDGSGTSSAGHDNSRDDASEMRHRSLHTAQNARSTVECVECRKPRVLYSTHKLTERQQTTLVLLVSEYEYSCGAPVTTPESTLHGKVVIRPQLTCAAPVEVSYYSSNIGRKDICSFCASIDAEVDSILKKSFKTVLPICKDCKGQGRVPVTMRPYGRNVTK